MIRPLVIVGDTPEADRLEELLAQWGWACLRAPEEEVTSTLARTKPPLLLLSLGPGAQGLASARGLTQRIRATAYGALVPMVFYGPGPAPSPVEVLGLGGDAFLTLPGDPAAIRSCVLRLAGDPAAPEPKTRGLDSDAATRAAPSAAPTPAESLAPESPMDDLDRLGALPWENLPDISTSHRRLATGPGAEPMDIDLAMAGDALLDPRTLAAAFAREAGGQVPARAEVSSLTPDPSPPATSKAIAASEGDPLGASWDPPPITPPPAEVDDFVSQLAGRGQESDTVAVRIQKAIEAFDAGALPPSLHGEDAAPGPVPDRPPAARGRARPKAPRGAGPEDGIDLSALDMDTVAGVEVANPDVLWDRLSQRPNTPAPLAPGPVTTVTTSGGGLPLASERAGTGIGISLSGLGSIPGPVTTSLPGPLTGSFSSIYLQDDEPTQPPLHPPGEPRPEQPPGGTRMEQPSGGSSPAAVPLASPYDLPPVVAGTQQSPMVVEHGFRDRRDTVPGRRTAILQGIKVDPGEEPVDEAPSVPADITHPESPASRRGRAAESQPAAAPGEAAEAPRSTSTGRVPAELRDGRLEELDPARLLCRLAEARVTGTLRVGVEEGTLSLLFQDGRIRFATSSRPGDRMLALLARQGLLSDLQAEEVESEIAASGRRAGAILLDRGWIKPAELIPSVREHLEHLVMEVFGLERGTFSFRAEWPAVEEIVHIEREPAALLFEGVRRKYVPDRVRRLLGAAEVRPIRRPQADESILAACALTGKDWRLLDAMDGRSTLSELGATAGVEPHHLWSLAFALCCLGLVALQAEPTRSAAAAGLTPGAQPGEDVSLEVEVQRILRRRDLAREGDYFSVLGAAPEATAAEIAEAYARTLRGLDAPGLPTTLAKRFAVELTEIRSVLREALDVLGDDRLRERYRRFLVAEDDTEA